MEMTMAQPSRTGTLPGRDRLEEIANAVTHGAGAFLSLAGLVLMSARAARFGSVVQVVASGIFGSSLVLLYAVSALYHAAREPRAKRTLGVLDHASIYLLIAGSYTAFSLGVVGGAAGWLVFGLEWALAAAGIVLTALFMERMRNIGVVLYVAMGWLIVIAWRPLVAAAPPASVVLLIAGGVAYTAGVAFYAMKRTRWMHTVWHLFVLGGSVCHVLSVLAALA